MSLIKYTLQMWMRNAKRQPGCITKNVEYQILSEAVAELDRLAKIEFWANELLYESKGGAGGARGELEKLITLPPVNRD